MTTQQLRFRIRKEDLETLDKLAEGVMTRQQAASWLLHLACDLIRRQPDKFKLLPKLEIPNDDKRAA